MTRFHYRCRMCGEIEQVPVELSTEQLTYELAYAISLQHHEPGHRLWRIHGCPSGALGISDLIGAVTEPEEKP